MREFLKQFDYLVKINAWMQCISLTLRNIIWNKSYNITNEFDNLRDVFDTNWRSEVKKKPKPYIYFIGTDESQDKSGLIPDLEELSELTFFEKYNKEYGQYSGLLQYGKSYGRELNTNKVIEDIEQLIKANKKPDIILMQAWGRSFNIDKLHEFKSRHDLKIINISLDDRLVFKSSTPAREKYNFGCVGLASIADLVLVSNPEVVNWYKAHKVNAMYFPMASSIKVFHPLYKKKKYDVGFVGNRYGYRAELIDFLIENQINVKVYGKGWNTSYLHSSKTNAFFNECKVVLGIGTVGHCARLVTQKLRDFDAPLSGAVYVTTKNNDLLTLYPDSEIILADTKEEFLTKIAALLIDPIQRHSISTKAFNTAKRAHTYKIRFRQLFSELGIY
ncbi:glycosyltransferase [Amylibacter sp.]|nr:glycosyltransferase [Amylibacter sp.]